jgi:S1-C subfamily serine protease
MHLKRPALKSIEDLVKRAHPLAPSQAAALRQIVQEIYLAGEAYEKDPTHGFLGILMDDAAFGPRDLQQPNDNTLVPGVVVADRIPGFCASRMLRDGDVILGTVEPAERFSSSNDLKNAIGNLEPGSVVRLQVLRQGQIIQIALTLDSRPIEADSPDTAQSFRIRRTEKFNEYWQRTFAPLLKESVG